MSFSKTNPNTSKLKNSLKGPVYAQLAALLKQQIASGNYPPGSKIPSEAAIGEEYGLAVMTVRQAIRLLVEQGILRRVHGSGTYVCGPDWTRASFQLQGLLEILGDQNNVDIRVLKANIIPASQRAATVLDIATGANIIHLVRLVSFHGQPFMLNTTHLIFNPKIPIVESELEVSSLYGLFSGEGNSFIKKAELKLDASILNPKEAEYLKTSRTIPAFKIRYIFYDYNDRPVGTGWFMTPMGFISFTTKIGVWADED